MKRFVFLAWAILIPSSAIGQGAIAGVVRSSAGSSIQDGTIEAASTALIERARTASTDSAGRYRLENLPPGTYSVTISAPGRGSRRYEGVDVTGASTTTIDATFDVNGRVAETVTVTGRSSAIDTASAERRLVLDGQVVEALPTARSYNSLVVLVPGVLTNSNDVVTGPATTSFPIHGGRTNEGRLFLDGLTIGSPPTGNSATTVVVDVGNAEEVSFTTAGGLGEVETAGVVMNVVSRSGGNSRHGSFFVSGTGGALQSDNVTPMLKSEGVSSPAPLTNVYDVSGSFGGPIAADRLWFFANGHSGGSRRDSTNVDYNLNAGDSSQWLYVPDPSRREYSDRTFEDGGGRLTWQMTPRQKISALVSLQSLCRTCTGATPGLSEPQRVSPEAVGVLGRPLYVSQVTWSSPRTNRLLLDAGFGSTYFGVGNFERDPNPTQDLVRVQEQCASGCSANGSIPGLVYRSQDYSVAYTGSYQWKATLSYVTGSHSLKAGYQHTFMTDDRTWFTNTENLAYRLNNGVPNQLTESISPWVNDTRAAWDGVFVQDQWTRGRLTLQGALRFDRSYSWFPQQTEGPSRFLPTAIVIPETRGVDSYKDFTPRVGAAYDLSGRGRTVVKANLGKYLEGAGSTGNYANTNPTLRLPQTTSAFGTAGVTRAWTDANHNFVPDCDLLNPNAQDLRASGGDLCGVLSNTSFGRNVLTNQFDPALLNGWNVRPSDWNAGVSLQQQLGARSSLDVAYTRRWFHGFSVTDNLATAPSDFTGYSLTAPLDPRLPGGGGYVIPGLYDVNPDKAGQVSNLVADSSRYGAWTQHYDGVDVTLNLRIGERFVFVGGTSTGRTVADNCGVRAELPELATTTTGTSVFGAGNAASAVTPASPYCHVTYGLLAQFNGLTTYTVPKIEVQTSATFRSTPGPMLAANYAAPNSAVAPSLGRNLSGNAPNVTVNLIAPGTLYGDRVNQLDLRVGKLLRFGRMRTLVALDTYNVLNSSAVLTYNSTFVPGGTWLQPLTVLTPRFFKLTAQVDF
jgi:hypothetical protein